MKKRTTTALVVTWIIGLALVIVIFGALEAVRRAFNPDKAEDDTNLRQAIKDEVFNRVSNHANHSNHMNHSNHATNNKLSVEEGMIGGLNVTSDDLVGYGESNVYSDKSDSKIYSDVAWKIKNCSTITSADVNRAVNDAVSKVRLERVRNCTSPEEKTEAIKQATDEAERRATITLTQKIKDEYCKLDCPAMKPLMMQYYDMHPVEANTRIVFNDARIPTNVDSKPTQCKYEFNYTGVPGSGSSVSKVVTKLFDFTKDRTNCVWTVSGMTDP
jgi:hypothetical protein